MNRSTSALYVCAIVLLLASVHIVHYYPQSPDRMVVHFDASGNPDGWSGKSGFYLLYIILIAFISGTFVALAFMIPRFARSRINIPHRSYWLAEERRGETFEFLSSSILWMGNLCSAFIVFLMHLTIVSNLKGDPKLGAVFWWALGTFLVLTLGQAAYMILKFSRVPAGAGAGDSDVPAQEAGLRV